MLWQMQTNPPSLLTSGTLHAAPELHPSRLLDPAFALVPFAGREAEVQKLYDWLALPTKTAIRVLHGPVGVGKTRLAAEWTGSLRENGLNAGFLEGPLSAERAQALIAHAPSIAAIDEAEHRAGLCEFLDALAAGAPDRPVRVLLLSRHIGDWWLDLADRGPALVALVQRLTATARLESFVEPDARTEELHRAARAFAAHLKHKVPPSLTLPEDPRFEHPLFLHMAALAAVLELDTTEVDVAAALLDHEERAWIRRAGLHNAPLRKRRRWLERIRNLAAAVVLRGGVHDRDALHKLAVALDVHKTAELTVEDIPPHAGGPIGTLSPAPVADALVARAMQGVAHETLEEMLHGADERTLRRAFVALASAESVDSTAVAAAEHMLLGTAFPARVLPALNAVRALGSGAHLAAALSSILREQGTLEEANSLPTLRPHGSLALADVALWIAETRLVSDMSEHELAETMNHYGEWLAALGRRAEALALAKEALDPLRMASAEQPKLLPELARSLRNLGKNLTALGERTEALLMLDEAAALLRRLAQNQTFAFRLELAATLRALGNTLSSLAQFDRAVAAAKEGVEMLRGLAVDRPDLALPELALTLCTLGRIYTREGEHESALTATQEAVDLLRQLALVQPDDINPQLAIGLNNLGAILAYLGNHRRAMRAAQESVDRFRRLSRVQPDPVNYARSCGVLGHIHAEAPQQAAALFAEGLRAVLPSYHADPQLLGNLRDALARDYTRVCALAGLAPDAALLETTDPG